MRSCSTVQKITGRKKYKRTDNIEVEAVELRFGMKDKLG